MASKARATLRKASYFMDQANKAGLDARENFVTNLEAAIVFGRSVIDHLRQEYETTHGQAFKQWSAAQIQVMNNDPVIVFFQGTIGKGRSGGLRNFIIHEGPVETRKNIVATISISIPMSVSVSYEGSYASRQEARIAYHTFRKKIANTVKAVKRSLLQTRQVTSVAPSGHVLEQLYFRDPNLGQRPAIDLVRDYLQKLTTVVDDAEKLFS